MSVLKVYLAASAKQLKTVENHADISSELQKVGVRFESWQAEKVIEEHASPEEVISAYQSQVDQLVAEYNFKSVDVIALGPGHPDRVALRQKFISEHTHSEFEVRFFVGGRGLFYIHQDEQVFAVMCEQGDLISVPANTLHWFDMGDAPAFKCIRLFTSPEGWLAEYSGDEIASRFPTFEQF